ncbi:hypothetical protein AAE478_001627, partial [Parahypoxylon ruwenzoriense]
KDWADPPKSVLRRGHGRLLETNIGRCWEIVSLRFLCASQETRLQSPDTANPPEGKAGTNHDEYVYVPSMSAYAVPPLVILPHRPLNHRDIKLLDLAPPDKARTD